MSKVNYRECDICGKVMNGGVFEITVRRLFNKMDICGSCARKIKRLSDDIDLEKTVANKVIPEGMEKYKDNECMCSAFLDGVEMTLNELSHNKLERVGINLW